MKYVYDFEEGNASMVDLLGGKGAGLAEMSKIGLNVPPGFTVTTEACRLFFKKGITKELKEEILQHLKNLEKKTNKKD
ncbi:MAG: PEP/pyruvate-binding domain-containing protein [Candidatus Woesearchaeota archaeon]